MNVLKKIMTAIKGGTRELSEFIMDSQGTRIFEQEIEEAKARLEHSKSELTHVMAKEMQAVRKVEIINDKLKNYEFMVTEALSKGDENLALELANEVAEAERDLAAQMLVADSYEQHVDKLKHYIEKSERELKEYERQLNIVKTTENIQKATEAITESYATEDARFLSAKQSLDRIKEKHAFQQDRQLAIEKMEAESKTQKASQLSDKEQLNDAQLVLEKLKDKK